MKVLIIVEKTKTGYSAYSPDIDGCVATGATKRQVERRMKSALASHLKEMGAYATHVEVTPPAP